VRVAVLTTSYPRDDDDFAGRFLADAVEQLRRRGVQIEVLAPGRAYRHWGLAYGAGMAHNLRRRPWAAPLLLASMARATRRAARTVEVIHAHWLQSAAAAALAGKPLVVTLHGTDMELARRTPRLAGALLRRAEVVICVSRDLAREARSLGAADVRVIPNGIDLPESVGKEADPPEVLFAGRLSPEKGIEDLVAVSDGFRLVVAGDGPVRARIPNALGFVPPGELARLYARAAVVACPSYREGFPLVCVEAMGHARPVVASAVGGLVDLVIDGETGLLVPPGDRPALRRALETLLADSGMRRRMGEAGRARVAELCSWDRIAEATLAAYADALRTRD
jgi:glycosyltransferase involved in cell wall biosynthesis